MTKPNVISLIKIDGEIYNQDELPLEDFVSILEKVLIRAAGNIGFLVSHSQKEKND